MAHRRDAEDAVRDLDGRDFGRRALKVEFAKVRGLRWADGARARVEGLPPPQWRGGETNGVGEGGGFAAVSARVAGY